MTDPLFRTEDIEARLTRAGAPFELRDAGKGGPLEFAHAPKSLLEIVEKAERRGDAPFLLAPDRTFTISQTVSAARHCATALQAGAVHFDRLRIGIAEADRLDWVVAFLATVMAGGVAVLLPENFDQDAECLAVPDLILCDAMTERSLRRLGYDGRCISSRELQNERGGLPELNADAVPDGEQPLASEEVIAFTSGSTGRPKAVRLSGYGVINGLMNMMLCSAIAKSEVPASPAPGRPQRPVTPCTLLLTHLSHVSGYTQILLAMMTGARLVLPPRDCPSRIIESATKFDITGVVGADPSITRMLLSLPDDEWCKAIKSWNVSGYRTDRSLVASLATRVPGVIFSAGYGLTECNGGLSAISGARLLDEPHAVGRVPKSVEVQVRVDPASAEGSDIGELWIRGSMLMIGYLDELDARDAEGWFPTGDFGKISADRQLAIFKRQESVTGDIVDFDEIRGILLQDRKLDDAAAMQWFEDCIAVAVVPRHGADHVSEIDGVYALLSDRYNAQQDAVRVQIVDHIPRTGAGKINYRALREMFHLRRR